MELLQLNRIECRFEERSLVNEASSSIMHSEARMVMGHTLYQNSQHSCDQVMDRKVGFRGH